MTLSDHALEARSLLLQPTGIGPIEPEALMAELCDLIEASFLNADELRTAGASPQFADQAAELSLSRSPGQDDRCRRGSAFYVLDILLPKRYPPLLDFIEHKLTPPQPAREKSARGKSEEPQPVSLTRAQKLIALLVLLAEQYGDETGCDQCYRLLGSNAYAPYDEQIAVALRQREGGRNRHAESRSDREQRDSGICAEGKRLRDSDRDEREIAGIIARTGKFKGPTGGPLSQNQISRILKKADTSLADVPRDPYHSRHCITFDEEEMEFRYSPADLLTRKQAAEYLGIKPHTLACWACHNRYPLPYIRVGRHTRYRVADL